MGNSGGGTSMAAGLSRQPEPTYSQYMASKDASDLAFGGAPMQKSESVTRSYGAGGGLTQGIGQLNSQNLGGLAGDHRRSGGMVNSEVGSMYKGNAIGDDDALSHFMGQSEFGGNPTEMGAQSLVGGQNPSTIGASYGQNMLSLKPPGGGVPPAAQSSSQAGPRKRESQYARPRTSAARP